MTPDEMTRLPDNTEVKCYAVRRVNPFIGVMQILETSGGRALSTNGIVWDIEVRAEHNSGWGSLNRNTESAFYRYGLWSKHDGLVSRPLAPHLDNDPLGERCAFIIHSIEQQLEQLPFALCDSEELWLYDAADTKPLALLASSSSNIKRPSPEPKYWCSHLGAEGLPSQYRFPQASELVEQVKSTAGFNVNKYWIRRLPDGSGVNELTDEIVEADVFPPFLITENWVDAEQKKRVSEYIDWIAPSLLTLQHLTVHQRQRLEKCLYKQAISIEHHRYLYSDVVDKKCITAALVQCKLQKANS